MRQLSAKHATPRRKWFHISLYFMLFLLSVSPTRTCSRTWTWTWTELDEPNRNLVPVARPRWPHWSCVAVSRGLNWFLKLNLAPLAREGRQRVDEGWEGCNLNGCGNWGGGGGGLLNVLCASPKPSLLRAALYTCLLLSLIWYSWFGFLLCWIRWESLQAV